MDIIYIILHLSYKTYLINFGGRIVGNAYALLVAVFYSVCS
jgi:hypothetical protein